VSEGNAPTAEASRIGWGIYSCAEIERRRLYELLTLFRTPEMELVPTAPARLNGGRP